MTEGTVIEARPRWDAPKCNYRITEDGRIKAAPGTEVRKITGTTIGALMGLNPFESPFTAQCRMLGLNDRDLSGNRAVTTGIALEPRVIDYLAAKHPDVGKFLPAETLFAERKGNHEDWKSDWDDPDFGGHVDAIITKDGQDYVLEIKTVKSIEHWRGEIPTHYLWQVYLYNHFLTKQDKAYFGIGVVDDRDYKNPDNWQPNSRNCILVEIRIDRDMVAQEIEKMRMLRKNIQNTLTTIPYDDTAKVDTDLMNHLRDYIAGKDEMLELCRHQADLNTRLAEIKSGYRQMEMELESTKARLKDVMLYHELTAIGPVKMKVQRRVSYDTARAEKDGIDLEPYMVVTEAPMLTFTKPLKK